jgi:MinD-like ATPase involved in chromosome partitioning or flagellar assembly
LATCSGEASTAIRAILAVGNPARERELREALGAGGISVIERCLDGPTLDERAQDFDADVALAAANLHRLSAATLVSLRESRLPLVLLAEPADFQKYSSFAHLLSSRSQAAEAVTALLAAAARGPVYAASSVDGSGPHVEAGGHEGGLGGSLLGLVGGKGAPGVTTMAIGLADALSANGRRVALMDADLRGGNLVPYLDLDPSRSILGLGVTREADAVKLAIENEVQDGPGFMVLAGIERPDDHRAVSAELALAAAVRLRESFDYVPVDAGQVISGPASSLADTLLRTADEVLVIAGSDLVAAWNAQCCLRHLRDELGLPPERLGLLLNKLRDEYERSIEWERLAPSHTAKVIAFSQNQGRGGLLREFAEGSLLLDRMPQFLDHHRAPRPPPAEMIDQVTADLSGGDHVDAATGVRGLAWMYNDNEQWCITEGPNADAVHKYHEGMGLDLGPRDVTQINVVR